MKELIGFAIIFIISTLMFWDLVHDIDKMSCQNKSQRPRDLDYSEAFELLRDGEKEGHNSKKSRTGMTKLEELKKRLGLIAMADERPALWRLCRSLVENLDEVQKEHDAELEEVRVISRGLQEKSEECENERREAEAKVTELEGQLRAMSDLANSAMADAQKWQNAYLKLRVETPIVHNIDVTWRNGEIPDGAIVMSQQAETALKAQEDRTPRYGYHKYHIKYYNYGDHRWHETELWCKGVKDVENWVLGVCDGTIPVYDCKVVA